MFLCLSLIPINTEAAAKSTSYAIVLSSAPGKNLKWKPQKSHLFEGRTVYVEQTTIKGSPWERLCLGFFSPREDASSILKEVQQVYPGAWITKVSTKNILSTIHSPTGPTATASTPSATTSKLEKTITGNTSSLTAKQLDSLMQRAKTDFKNQNYSSAIRYLTALVTAENHKDSQEALELLGMARQRKGQNSHAVVAYETYLTLYPEADGANRVNQRLAGLLTATSTPRKKIHMTTAAEEINEVTAYGSLAQTYINNKAITDDIGDVTTVSQLNTFLDVTAIQKSNNFDQLYQFTAEHIYDFIDDEDEDEFRFIEAYYEVSHRKTGTSGRFGRQLLRLGGIRKRFDGISAGYQINPDMRLNVLGGFPVDIDNKTSINEHRIFYGFTFETGTFLQHWDMNLFYFNQEYDGLDDGTSVGTEVRYRDKRTSLFGLIDYDTFYKEVNILQLNVNILFDHGRTAYMNAFMRKSPILSISNALIGRSEETIEELQEVLNIEQIYQLARDRTANSQTVTVGGSSPVSEKFQVTADLTLFSVGETVASGGVPATEDTGPDYFVSTQLVGNNLMMKHDTGVLGIRYYTSEPSNTISFIVNSRFPITRHWRINPRLQYDIRNFNDGRSQDKLRVLLRTDYRYLNKARFDIQIGYDDTSEENNGQSLGYSNLFFTLGYRWDF
jgi:tetratricopeptide (TPR) repeat protein